MLPGYCSHGVVHLLHGIRPIFSDNGQNAHAGKIMIKEKVQKL